MALLLLRAYLTLLEEALRSVDCLFLTCEHRNLCSRRHHGTHGVRKGRILIRMNCGLSGGLADLLPEMAADHERAGRQAFSGFTCAVLAAEMGLPEAFLQERGLTDIYASDRAVRLPCYDRDGREIAARILYGDGRPCWKKESRPCLYGLDCLDEAEERGVLLLTRCEMEALVLRYSHYPALALPKDTQWREEWASLLLGVPKVCALLSPGETVETAYPWLEQSVLKERAVLVTWEKPFSSDSTVESSWIESQLELGVPWSQAEAERREAVRQSHYSACSTLAEAPDVLALFESALGPATVPDDLRWQKLLFLAGVSRLLDSPVSVVIKGPSAVGKSHLLQSVLAFFPAAASEIRTTFSPKALAYGTGSLEHKMLVLYEAAGIRNAEAEHLLRTLLSEGCIRYEATAPGGKGTERYERKGPTGLLMTTTETRLHPENETRLFSILLEDTPERRKAILVAQAQAAAGIRITKDRDYAEWHALQEWLALGPQEGVIPFACHLIGNMAAAQKPITRGFERLLSLINAHALLHQASRERDDQGRIVATVADYAAVYPLVVALFPAMQKEAVPAPVRQVVEYVRQHGPEGILQQEIATGLKRDKSTVSRNVNRAVEGGWLLRERRGGRSIVRPGNLLPEANRILPTPEAVRTCCNVAPQQTVSHPSPPPAASEETFGTGVRTHALLRPWERAAESGPTGPAE